MFWGPTFAEDNWYVPNVEEMYCYPISSISEYGRSVQNPDQVIVDIRRTYDSYGIPMEITREPDHISVQVVPNDPETVVHFINGRHKCTEYLGELRKAEGEWYVIAEDAGRLVGGCDEISGKTPQEIVRKFKTVPFNLNEKFVMVKTAYGNMFFVNDTEYCKKLFVTGEIDINEIWKEYEGTDQFKDYHAKGWVKKAE